MNDKKFLVLLTLLIILITFLLGVFLKKASAADIVATITTGIFEPQSPLNLAVSTGDSSVNLSWSTPISNGGSVITDFIIEYKLTVGGVWSVFADGVSTTTFALVTGLSNDNPYEFRVSAVNSIGQGPLSMSVSAIPGAPAQVIVSNFKDLSVPSIVTAVRITNEGSTAYEYQYSWCVTDSDINLCGGGDDIFNSSAAKLIQPGENWDTDLASTVSTLGMYWFHLQVVFGSDTSYASQSFITTVQSHNSSGGGGSSSSKTSKAAKVCVGADLNHDNKVSLIDFSILIVFFKTLPPFSNYCADINSDEKVNMTDFSILLTQWGKKPIQFRY